MVHPPSLYLQVDRPWFELYNTRLPKPTAKRQSLSVEKASTGVEVDGPSKNDEAELSPIQRFLGEHLLAKVFQFLPTYSIASAACACEAFRRAAETPKLWETACDNVFHDSETKQDRQQIVDRAYQGSWKRMFILRPHIRFDGLYVSRNTYIRVGEQSFRVKNPVHLVLYFRYLRFMPGGCVVYRTCPCSPSVVGPTMLNYQRYTDRPSRAREGINIMQGRYRLEADGRLYTSVLYPGSKSTEVRFRLGLRSIVQGANNRIDIKEIVTYDREEGRAIPLPRDLGEEDDEDEHIPGRKKQNRGMNTFVFVPWEWMNSTILNLSLDEMDYYVTG